MPNDHLGGLYPRKFADLDEFFTGTQKVYLSLFRTDPSPAPLVHDALCLDVRIPGIVRTAGELSFGRKYFVEISLRISAGACPRKFLPWAGITIITILQIKWSEDICMLTF